MPIAPPLVVNGIKTILVLGVGLGGHQIYWKLAGNYLDDGFFYFADKMSLPNKELLKRNKVYNSDSAISKRDEYFTRQDLINGYRNSYHVGFKTNSRVREKLNTLYYNGFGDRASVYKVIKDHTLKLAMPCSAGTGWLLDFAIPEQGKYPTKWFIATNLHVINMFKFKDNPYKVSLPITEDYLNDLRFSKYRSGQSLNSCENALLNGSTELNLYTEKDEYDKNVYPEESQQQWRQYRNEKTKAITTIYTTTINSPKLVYAAIDFLGPRYTVSGHQNKKVSYFKDFGVMEVDFANENQARIMTNGAYDKYYKNQLVGQRPAIDFFAPELMSKYDSNQLANSEDRYYLGGYPGGVSENLSFNINAKLKVTEPVRSMWNYYDYYLYYNTELTNSKLAYFKKYSGAHELETYNLLNSRGQVIPGHASIDKIDSITNDSKIMWNGRQLSGWGYNYLIDNTFLGKGASGSMVLNQDGELLGLYRMYNDTFNYGFVEPLRASWVVDDKGRIILPGFDLLTGTEGQAVSYKSQLIKHNPYLNTYLRSKSWNLKS